MPRSYVVGMILLLAGTWAARPVFAVTCDTSSIQAIAPKKTTINSATETVSGATPYCQIEASMTTSKAKHDVINFELDLPDPAVWNARFQFQGNGGFGGDLANLVNSSNYITNLQNGYAMAATDTGHTAIVGANGQSLMANASWAASSCNAATGKCVPNTPAIKDFAYRAVHKSTVSAQAIISGYYGNLPYHSYFFGCSTAGRQALVEAQLYPADFDGIVAGDSAIGDPFIDFNWNAQAMLQSPTSYITPQAIDLVNNAVIAQCGDPNGPADTLVINPAPTGPNACTFDPTSLLCPAGQTSGCLSAGQVAAFKAIYAGAVDTKGKPLYVGYSVSDPAEVNTNDLNESDPSWEQWITGCVALSQPCTPPTLGISEPWGPYFTPTGTSPSQWIFQDQVLKYFVFNNANYDSSTFDFTKQSLINKVMKKNARWGGDGMNPNLSPFVKLNHKLLMYHGWSDAALSPYISVNYYNSVVAKLGSTTTDNVRLFMLPGVHHCGQGPGPNFADFLDPMVAWVEQGGPAPDGIVATHYLNNDPTQQIQRTMPLCAYPEQPQYIGPAGGPYTNAATWECSTGTPAAAKKN